MSMPGRMKRKRRKKEKERKKNMVAQVWCGWVSADLLEALVVDKACSIVGQIQLALCDGFSEFPATPDWQEYE